MTSSSPSPATTAGRSSAFSSARSRISTARALFLAAAFLSFVASVALYFGGDETEGIFVGLWVPSILALGSFLVPPQAPR